MLLVWPVTAVIGVAHLHHSIVGTVEVLAGLFAGQGITWGDFAHFLFWSTVGHAFGGFFFVSVINYSHEVRSRQQTPQVELGATVGALDGQA